MKYIYKVSQSVNNDWNTYDSMIVVADSVEEASKLDPSGYHVWSNDKESWMFIYHDGTMSEKYTISSWCLPHETEVELIGVTDLYNESKVLLASFNAG